MKWIFGWGSYLVGSMVARKVDELAVQLEFQRGIFAAAG